MCSVLHVTPEAETELLNMGVSHTNFLRVWVESGGCSGFLYQADIDTETSEYDIVVYENESIRVVTDLESAPDFRDITLDYSADLISTGFRFVNPNASATCGCGSSFQR